MTVANAVISRLKAIQAGIANVTCAVVLLNMILDGTSPIVNADAKEAIEDAGNSIKSDGEVTIGQPQAASSSTPYTTVTILKQMMTLKALLQNQQSFIDRLRQRQNKGGMTDLISSLQEDVINAESNVGGNEIERAPRKKKKKKPKHYYESSSSRLDFDGPSSN